MTFVFFNFMKVVALIVQILLGGAKLHIEVVNKILNANINFFETNTIGKILVRFSKD